MYEQDEKLKAVRGFSDSKKDFDDSFLSSLEVALDTWGEMSSGQEDALDNIIESFQIDVEDYL